MIGLPGQTAAQLARDLRFFARADLDMIGMGPYLPHHATPLGRDIELTPIYRRRQLMLGLKTVAACRLYLHDVNIAATTALQALAPDGRERGLLAGANVIMPSLTPETVSADYAIYPGKNAFRADARARVEAAREAVRRLGLTPSTAVGGSKRRRHVG